MARPFFWVERENETTKPNKSASDTASREVAVCSSCCNTATLPQHSQRRKKEEERRIEECTSIAETTQWLQDPPSLQKLVLARLRR